METFRQVCVELHVQPDHVHLVAMIPPKMSISRLLGWGNLFLGQGLLC
jgi:REP element-mobilizing transposase RayT